MTSIWEYCRKTLGLKVEFDMQALLGYSAAVFSQDDSCRLLLARIWDPSIFPAVFVMCNPSTADAFKNDNTIKRCVAFARRWGCGGLVVVNLFALRARDPKVMLAHPEPVGARNDDVIAAVAGMDVEHWVAAWGRPGTHRGRAVEVRALLAARGVQLQHLGLTDGGQPKHPLYLNAETPLTVFPANSINSGEAVTPAG
jgi:hypothetical protein